MGYREDVLRPHGYHVTYTKRPAYRGSDPKVICTATKGGTEYFAFKDPGHYHRIRLVQDSIPHMARMVEEIGDVILLETASGRLLWEIDAAPDPIAIERQLNEFAAGTEKNGLIHGDIRPWNIFVDDHCGISVIDWNLSRFVDDLRLGDDLLVGHFTNFHKGLKISELARMDLVDAHRIMQLLKGEIRFAQAWPQNPLWYPAWCKH